VTTKEILDDLIRCLDSIRNDDPYMIKLALPELIDLYSKLRPVDGEAKRDSRLLGSMASSGTEGLAF
jgi:hypothetical protein